ncbi:ras-GEF domain-containing family member 1B-A isoform X1 [Agrilus planipennis]|uniref:Ras-GEF domain-containing family member 1B-A isoform X1 n=1 Tax=Agrilus planipennis TaxID=224129 RepID=A0A1W4X711_AGRPL|nr:ras-GEF domain-containing family member 1B-A isoform X1 [Agrilus planipennis]
MQDHHKRPENEGLKVSNAKPTIASKPKYIPPVNIAFQKFGQQQQSLQKTTYKSVSHYQDDSHNERKTLKDEFSGTRPLAFHKDPPPSTQQSDEQRAFQQQTSSSHQSVIEHCSTCNYSKCQHFQTTKTNNSYKHYDERNDQFSSSKESSSSPSTVCCSILSNVSNDCCGITGIKENKTCKSVVKVESIDSNSSDSGGFNEFLQREALLKLKHDQQQKTQLGKRIPSQPDCTIKNNNEFNQFKQFGHQRKFSQPEYPLKELKKPGPVPTAQALEQFLLKPEQRHCLSKKSDEDISKSNSARSSSIYFEKNEDVGQISSQIKRTVGQKLYKQSRYEQSTKKLEELLLQRLEKEEMVAKSQNCMTTGYIAEDIDEKMMVQKQIHQKLQADLQRTVKQIQEIKSIELRLPQNKKWSEGDKSQHPAGLNQKPKHSLHGPAVPDFVPKDFSKRRSLPQTHPTGKIYSKSFKGGGSSDLACDSNLQNDNALVYRDGNLLSGSLEALIQHMVPTDVYYPDRAYLFAFLLSSRLFIKPFDLLTKVKNMYEAQQNLNSAINTKDIQPGHLKFVEHLVQLLIEWTETFPYDFREEKVMQLLRLITQQCIIAKPSLHSHVSSLLHNLLQRLTALEKFEKSLEEKSGSADDNIDILELCPKPEILAQQLTHVELERLSFIGPEEFVQAFAKENLHIESSLINDTKKTHNLEQYIQWFNRLSYFVATQVLKHVKKKQRVRVIEYWIETGRECFNIGNFNSLMAIIAGLNMSPVARLKKTWHKIQSGKFTILEHQMDPSSNFSSYRSTLKAAMWRSAGATDQRQRIVIPFFSLLVKDLYFLNQGCSNRLPNGHVNFEKFWQLAKQVTEFMAWKQVDCPFEKDPRIIAVLQHAPVLNENALSLASFDCENPDNIQEKEMCKHLKCEGSST